MTLSLPKRTSLVSQVVEILRTGVSDGTWTEWLPGERTLCDRLNVSRPTLRLALRELEKDGWLRVERARRRRIVPSAHPRQARHGLVVLLMPLPLYSAPPLTLFWIDEMRDHLIAAGYHLEIESGERYYRESPENALRALVRQSEAAGWVLWRSTARMQAWFTKQNLPCLVAGSCHPGISLPSLDLDHRSVCRHAAAQFLAKGHQRLALIIDDAGFVGDLKSVEGVQEAWVKFNPAGPAPAIARHNGTVEGVIARLDGLLSLPNPPTAFLVARSATVLTVLGHLLRRGVRLPQDAVLISRDDDPFLEWVIPTVARYALKPKLYARAATRIVVQLAQGQPVPHRESRLTPEFIKGETFGRW